ncbi:MAG TPA: HAD family hydrolase [Myxococcota bacterium]|nr:HAD family hydrolase [Myxococcota bacterium]
MIRAVTFDFWDTIVVDDSDEPERARRGLATKQQARWALFRDEVRAHADRPLAAITGAWDEANARFRHQWKVEHHTPHIAERVRDALARLDLGPTPGFDALVHALATMEVDVPPALAPGIVEALDALAGRCRLGIISDTIVTPGVGLRDILRGYGLLDRFDGFVFSDEVGACKPAPRVFELAAEGLGVPLGALAHVGDREENDVTGPMSAGARGVLYVGVVDRGRERTRADAVCADHRELPDLIAAMEGR